MSAEGITALFERVQGDEEFRSRLEEADTSEAKRRIVTDAGFDVEPGDLDTLRSLAGLTELSDADLERVAGGSGTVTGFTTAVGSYIGAVAAAAFL